MPQDWRSVPTLPGRISLDIYHYVQTHHPQPGPGATTLGAVSSRFLDQRKEDIHFSMINELQHGTQETRRRLAIYCAKESQNVITT